MTPLAPECPRCGYDQTGVVDSWRDSCPLAGLCPECGLEFEWRNLLNPAFASHLNLFEHAKDHRIRAWWRTTRKTWRPRRFWKWVRPEHPIRPSRLLFIGITGFITSSIVGSLLTIGLFTSTMAVFAVTTDMPLGFVFSGLAEDAPSAASPLYAAIDDGTAPALAVLPPLMVLLTPLAFLLLPRTFRRARVRPAHLLRIGVYTLIGFALAWHIPTWIGTAIGLFLFIMNDSLGVVSWDFTGAAAQTFADTTIVAIPIAWTIWAWYRAARDYLRLPRPSLVTLVLSVLALAASGLLIALVALAFPWILYGYGYW